MRTLSLASGTLPEFDPVRVVEAAAAGGFPACGIWFDAGRWTATTTRRVAGAFRASGVRPLEIEVIVLGDRGDEARHRSLLDAGAAIGATEAIVVSLEADVGRTADLMQPLCAHARGSGINLCLEFLPIFAIRDLRGALAVLERVAEPNARLLVDPLHLARSGGAPADLAGLRPELLSFAQFCDAPAEAPGSDYDALRAEALDGRSVPGAGGLPLGALLEVLPADIPLSLELRSAALRAAFPDPGARARHVFEASCRYLESGSAEQRAPAGDP
jgi:sugar phosphate isomerase/epimerase